MMAKKRPEALRQLRVARESIHAWICVDMLGYAWIHRWIVSNREIDRESS